MRLLRLQISEPLPGKVLPDMAVPHGADEATRRYKAIVVTTLRQLRGLHQTRIQIECDPADADEAIRFWLLPRLADHWQSHGDAFLSDGWEISFGCGNGDYQVEASGHILCPWMGSRWIHTAMLGLEQGTHRAIGHSPQGDLYLHAQPRRPQTALEERILPPLSVILTEAEWQEAIESPLGPALKRAWEEELD